MKTFETLKQEILQKAKEQKACKAEYKRFLNAKNISEAQGVIIDNFHFVITKNIINLKNAEYFKGLKVKDNTISFKAIKYTINKEKVIYENYFQNGQLMSRIIYKNGKQNGRYKEWYSNGRLSVRANYKDGEKNRLFESWHYNGQLHSVENYKDGERNGICKYWNYDGSKSDKRYYIGNKEVSKKEWKEFTMSN